MVGSHPFGMVTFRVLRYGTANHQPQLPATGLGYMVNSPGDRFRPIRMGLWDPFQMAVSWLINGGDPNHLQVLG